MLQIDQVLQNRYRIIRVLGHGGMGAVYEARHIKLDMDCVIKEMLSPDEPVSVDMLSKQFEREGKALASLKHPNLPRVSDYFVENNNYYLVMDLIRGKSLEKLIGPNGLPETTVLQYADQLLEVLEYIHGQGVVHRDIKPANIMVQSDGRVILIDFGLLKVINGMMTKFSMPYMSMNYAPPEQHTGGDLTDARSDLYSLAATLYEALSATLPTDTDKQIYRNEPLIFLSQLKPQISKKTARAIEKTLALDPAKRYQSAAEMRAALISSKPKGNKRAIAIPKEEFDIEGPPVSPTIRLEGNKKPFICGWTQIQVLLALVFVTVFIIVAAVIVPSLISPIKPETTPTMLLTRMPVATTRPIAQKTSITVIPTDTTAPMATNTSILQSVTQSPKDILPVSTITPVQESASSKMQSTATLALNAQASDQIFTLAPGVTIEMVRIPAGEFLMGSAGDDTYATSEEKPQHKVMLDDYLIGKYDVTNAQFSSFVMATGYKTTAEKEGSGNTFNGGTWPDTKGADWRHPNGPNSNIEGKGDHPVVLVSWDDAIAFCEWMSQLTGLKVNISSEAQWEKAARGTDGRLYPWGNHKPDAGLLSFNLNVKDTTPVGSYSPAGDSPYSLADMVGNVWQWTSSLYQPYPYHANDGREDTGNRSKRVLRGGAFDSVGSQVRSAARIAGDPSARAGGSGFRVVASPFTNTKATPTSMCSIDVDNQFRALWERVGGSKVGCPSRSAISTSLGYQPFQHGVMIWRKAVVGDASSTIYVLYEDHTWQAYRDEWVSGMDMSANYKPPQGLLEPKSGFGYVWRKQLGGTGSKLGWATQEGTGVDKGLVQDFGVGSVTLSFPSQIFLLTDGTWSK